MNTNERRIYSNGKVNGIKDKSLCPYGYKRMRQRSWWLAGWHDYQIEKGTGVR